MKHTFAEGSAEHLFRELDKAHRNAMDAMMEQVGLGNVGQPMVLVLLYHAPEGIIASQRELAARMGVTPATVTVSLKSMERTGYIRRLPDDHDMRRKRIAITEKGRAAVAKLDVVLDQLDHGMYAGFDAAERAELAALFSRMIQNLRQISVSAPCAASE